MPSSDSRNISTGDAADRALQQVLMLTRIGPYRIIRQLGEGGMGVVYLAEQDEPVRREVALKVLRAGTDTTEVVARFESERQALALMEHPNITRVYDAGVTDSGLPYFVMECVAGVPITEYATAHRLTVHERVRLFLQVCYAVQHAHQKGIIHRDIKPSNVLVAELDGAPHCKVIDFGIAKATAPSAGGARLTSTGHAIGTPAYMSPEQFVGTGSDIDTRSDIYSCGVLLYELLTGVLPFDAEQNVGWALVAQHMSGDVPSPSSRYGRLATAVRAELARQRRTDSVSLHRAITGDLDAVILKALERDRDARYATANDLARDLAHYLADEPITATSPSRTYRMRKFVRRHRFGVVFAATVLALLIVSAATATYQASRLARANAIAVARQGQAEELIGFMLGNLRAQLASIGRTDVLDSVGRKALDYFDAVPETELSDKELFRRSEALMQLGQVRMDQGKLPVAADLFRQSLALSARLTARDSLNGPWQIGLGHSHFWAGSVDWQQGNADAALSHFLPFVAISRKLLTRYPDSLAYRRELAYALSNIGSVKESKGDFSGALENYREGLALRQELVARDSANQGYQSDLALAYNSVGYAQRKLGDFAGSLASHRAELALKERLAARDTSDTERQRYLAIAHNFLAALRLNMGDVDSARSDAQAGRAIYTTLVLKDPENKVWTYSLANIQRSLAHVLLERGDATGALRELEGARSSLERLRAIAPDNQVNARELRQVQQLLGRALLQLGRAPAALVSVRQSVAGGEAVLLTRPADMENRRVLADAQLVLGDVLHASRDGAGANGAWSRALALVDSAARATRQTELLAIQAAALMRLGRADEARAPVLELARHGYRRPSFVALARQSSIAGAF